MIIQVIDATGRTIGTVDEDNNVFNLKGKKLFEAKPETTIKEITQKLLADLLRCET